MVNFLILTGIGPTKHFFGCFPLRLGMAVLFILQGGIIAGDILEHEMLFEDSNVVNKWATMSIQIVVALVGFVAVFWQNKCYSIVVYFTLLCAAAATVAEKVVKVVAFEKLFLPKKYILCFEFIYSARAAFEFLFYFYTAYIAYSYSTSVKEKKEEFTQEKLVHSSKK